MVDERSLLVDGNYFLFGNINSKYVSATTEPLSSWNVL